MIKSVIKILGIIFCFLFVCGCSDLDLKKEHENNKNNQDTKKDVDMIPSDKYSELDLWNFKFKFKMAKNTNLWNCNDNFGAMEVDTVYMVSENGVPIPNYYDVDKTSGVIFQIGDFVIDEESEIRNKLSRWYNISNAKIEDVNDSIYSRYIKGESSNVYYESYGLIITLPDESKIYYSIELVLYKNNYSKDMINKIIQEYHIIIDSLKIIYK